MSKWADDMWDAAIAEARRIHASRPKRVKVAVRTAVVGPLPRLASSAPEPITECQCPFVRMPPCSFCTSEIDNPTSGDEA